MGGSDVFGPCDDLFRLLAHRHVDHIRLTSLFVNYTDSSVVTSMRHAFVNRRIKYDCDFLSGQIFSENSAQPDLASFTGLLPEKVSCP